ncbi:MAG: RloB domain-containing protein [Tyzzerella sp.]|nr:RloB domain-containing protein [Tyzzerella sp.]
MSLKPPKKSDMSKSWMKKKPDRGIKIHPEYHLIISEGTDTEPAYFGTIKDIINKQYPEKIQLDVSGAGDNTVHLFEKAKALAKNNPNQYRHVWVVYDTDDFPAEHIDMVVHLCNENSTEETEYHPIWSNQCVELWFLLHFCFMQSDIHRTEYWPKLTEWLNQIDAGAYVKNRTDMYQILRPFMDTAIANAKKLNAINEGRLPSKAAPGTKVYELVEMLKPYLTE